MQHLAREHSAGGDLVADDWDAGTFDHLYVNDGTGFFADMSAAQMPLRPDRTESLALCDIDGDGDLDLVLGNWSQNLIFLNDGLGGFSDATAVRLPVSTDFTAAVALGDVDHDGDLDLVSGNDSFGTSPNEMLLQLNLQRQLDASAAPQIGQLYTFDAYLRYGPPSAVDLAAVYLSSGAASLPLPPFGTVGIDPALAAPLPLLAIPQTGGVASIGFVVPNQPSLVGLQLYSQAMLVAYPSDLRLSNVVADVVQ